MTLASIGGFVEHLDLSTAVRESTLAYPILLSTHLTCIATFGGLILVTNLRLMNWLLTDIPVDEFIRALRPWKQAGFVIMVSAGVLLGASKAEDYLTNPYFQIKLALLVSLGVHGLVFRRAVYRSRTPASPSASRAAALLSIILWLGVASMGRWIAYYDRPTPAPTSSAAMK